MDIIMTENVRPKEKLEMNNFDKEIIKKFREKWEGANTGGHNSISTPVMNEMLSDISSGLYSQRQKIKEEIEGMKHIHEFKNIGGGCLVSGDPKTLCDDHYRCQCGAEFKLKTSLEGHTYLPEIIRG